MSKLQEYSGHFCESEYEYAFLSFLEDEGWNYLAGSSVPRSSKKDVLYMDDMEQFLSKTNSDLMAGEVRQIMDNVRLVGAETDFATLHKAYGWMVDGVQFTPQGALPRMVALIDFEHPENNIFRVVNQFSVEYVNNGQKETRRPDILLFVNGSKDADDNMKAMVSKPYAKVLREALPNATFVGFSGTPISETYQTFGDEIDRYTMDQAVADGLTVSIKYHPRIAKVLLDQEKVKAIKSYYKKCADDGATAEDIEASKKAMSSMEIILSEPSRLERLAVDIHDHYVSSCSNDPDRVQKAMIVCSRRPIAYKLLKVFQDKYPEWFVEKKVADGVSATDEELRELKPMPFMAMVSSVGSNDSSEMYNYLGGVKNSSRSEDLDAAFKQDKSNFHIVIVVDMWITGFDVPSLTYMYNDKPLKKHMLIQTISRVNRKHPGKEYGLIIDYIGIRDNMREAMKLYGGDSSVAPSPDDVKQATDVFRETCKVMSREKSKILKR